MDCNASNVTKDNTIAHNLRKAIWMLNLTFFSVVFISNMNYIFCARTHTHSYQIQRAVICIRNVSNCWVFKQTICGLTLTLEQIMKITGHYYSIGNFFFFRIIVVFLSIGSFFPFALAFLLLLIPTYIYAWKPEEWKVNNVA